MLEWTGERFLPWRKDPALAYEHLHRYLYAAQLTSNKTVLDLASGEGYGSNILAQTAASVVGIDIDDSAIEHARMRYTRDNLRFFKGSVTEIPLDGSNPFDVVVCFEAIEHVADQDRLLSEVSRLIKTEGILVVSTPNKTLYDETIQEENEFHVRELNFEEFRTLIGKYFKHVRFLGQRIFAESNVWPIEQSGDPTQFAEFIVERHDSEFQSVPPGRRVPMYLVAVASNAPIDAKLPTSVLVDAANELLEAKAREIHELLETKESQEVSLKWRADQLAERDKSIEWFEEETESLRKEIEAHKTWHERDVQNLNAEIEAHKAEIEAHKAWHERTVADLGATIAAQEEGLAWRAGQVEFLEKEKTSLLAGLTTTTAQLVTTREQLEAIHASSGWKMVLKLRHYRDALRRLIRRH